MADNNAELAMIPESAARTLVGALFLKYICAVDEAKLNYGVAARLIGVSRARFSSLKKDAEAGIGSNISTHVFLSLVRATKRISVGMGERWLPTSSSRGAPQELAEKYLRGEPTESVEEEQQELPLE